MLWMRQKILSWGMGFFWYHIETFFMFQTFSFILIHETFTFKLFANDKFGFACLSANIIITMHNVVIGIINEPRKLWLRDILEFMLFSFRTRPSSVFWCFFCEKVLFFANRGHLQALKVCDLKLLCPSQFCGLKDRKIKVRI